MAFLSMDGKTREADIWYALPMVIEAGDLPYSVYPVGETYEGEGFVMLLWPDGTVHHWGPWSTQAREKATHWMLKSWDWYAI